MKLGLFTAWMASLGLVTWRTFSKEKRAPLPSEMAATIVIYGTLGVLGGDAERPAAIFGWGLLLAALLNLYDPTLKALNGTPVGTLETGGKVTSAGPIPSGSNISQAGRLA